MNADRESPRQRAIREWIAHSEAVATDGTLSAARRSLARARLQRLYRLQEELGGAANPAPGQGAEQLLDTLLDGRPLPSEQRRLLSHMQPILRQVAEREGPSFDRPLHPLRQLLINLATLLDNWRIADSDQRQRINFLLRQITKRVVSDPHGDSRHFHALNRDTEPRIRELIRDIQESTQDETERKRRLAILGERVTALLQQRLKQQSEVPPAVSSLILGPWRDHIVWLQLREGANSPAAQRALQLVEDLLWYVQAQKSRTAQQRALIVDEQLERELLRGLRQVGLDEEHARSLIGDLHRLHILANTRGSSQRCRR